MILACQKCKFSIESDAPEARERFYPKYKDKPLDKKSSWSSVCALCMKAYKKAYYELNKAKINQKHLEARRNNIDHFHQVEANRRLRKSKAPESIQQRRAIQALPPSKRYLHDRAVAWKVSAAKRNISWKLSDQDLFDLFDRQQGLCYYTGHQLVLGPNSRLTVSLDRIDPTRPYEPGNVAFCGTLVNKMKHELSPKEFLDHIQLLLTRASSWCPGS